MKTYLIIQAIKNCAEVAANLKGEPLIKEEKKYNPNGKDLKTNKEEKTDEENEDKVEAADPIGDAEEETDAALNREPHNRQEIVLEYEFYIFFNMLEIIYM